jgi:hypothetical protein
MDARETSVEAVNDSILEKRGILAQVHEASYRFLFFWDQLKPLNCHFNAILFQPIFMILEIRHFFV